MTISAVAGRTGWRRSTALLAALSLGAACLVTAGHPVPALAREASGEGSTPGLGAGAGGSASGGIAAARASSRSGSATLLSGDWGDDDTRADERASAATGDWDARKDVGSLFTITDDYGAQDTWRTADDERQKITGKGVGVALIDTGVAPVSGLDFPGKVVNGPDLSYESQSPNTRYLDGYGHGTHMAAIIAGRDPKLVTGSVSNAKSFVGIAPDATIVNVKVGAADGGSDVSQIIAAIDWVVQHRDDRNLNIRVLNLSYGTGSRQPYTTDPLAHAVENAWRHGIVVVVAAGNDGASDPTLTMPAADPFVVAVGAVDHRGSDSQADDTVADFSNPGTASRRPDLLAPGKSLVSLRVPGSYADRGHPEGLVTGDDSGRLFRGSGTSQAAAVVSGSAALLLPSRPELTPDQVKRLLTGTARPLTSGPNPGQGAGVIDVERALKAPTPPSSTARQAWAPSTGTGSLELARAGNHVVDPDNGVALTDEVDALGADWDAHRWAAASARGAAWSGGIWNGRRWAGDDWSGDQWAAGAWNGVNWAGVDWLGRRWSGDEWSGRRWSGGDWHARRWSAESWEARRWSGASWGVSTAW